jgi:hypothetical protein
MKLKTRFARRGCRQSARLLKSLPYLRLSDLLVSLPKASVETRRLLEPDPLLHPALAIVALSEQKKVRLET